MADIGSIFAEMKADSASMKAVNLENLNQSSKKSKKATKKKSKSKTLEAMGLESLSVSLPGDSSLPGAAPKPDKQPLFVDPESTVDSIAEGIMDMVREGGSSQSMTAMGDSDDESGDEEGGGGDENAPGDPPPPSSSSVPALPPPPPSTRGWTNHRFNSALSSQELKIRTDALQALYHVVVQLSKTLPSLPELDLPPPYDPSRIVLTHKQGAMVSDMAKGEHAPHWAAWQKTHSSLMSQFLEDKTAAPAKPNMGKRAIRGQEVRA